MRAFISRRARQILFVCVFILSSNIFGQDLKILNTKDLIGISEKYGLDSALTLTNGIPIFYIDESTAEQLINQIKYNKPSYKIEEFLVDYALCMNKTNLSEVFYDFFNRKKDEIENEIKEYSLNHFSGLPEILQNSLFALIKNSSKQTDSLLFNYYELWNEKSVYYKQDYERGVKEANGAEKEKLMSPYEKCHYNCYILQYFLKKMKSPFYKQEKLEYHQKNLVDYLRDGFAVEKDTDCSKYVRERNTHESIKLKKEYNSIGDIDFNKEIGLKNLFKSYNKSNCRKFIIYNDKNGYLSLGCSGYFGGSGAFYKLELKNDKLIIHKLYTWVS